MGSSEQQLGWLVQPGEGGGDVRGGGERSVTDIKFISSQNYKKLQFTFELYFINSY
jgi:hypothetical protein